MKISVFKEKLWIYKIPSTVAGQNLSSKNAGVLNKTSKNSRKKQKKTTTNTNK